MISSQKHSRPDSLRRELQVRLRAIRRWFEDKELWLVFFAAVLGLVSFFGIPELNRAMRLRDLGRTNPVIIADGYSKTVGSAYSGAETITKAMVSGNGREFWADRLYHKGEHAYLTYSDRLSYGVITATPPKSLFDIVAVDTNSLGTAFFILAVIGALIISNLGLILLAVFEHTLSLDVTNRLTETPERLQRFLVIGAVALEAMLAAALSFVPIAAAMAAFFVSLKIDDENPRTMYLIYGSVLLFCGSHVTAGAAISLLRFFRSKLGHGLKEIAAYLVSLLATGRVLFEIGHLTFGKNVANLSSWWQVAKEFGRALIG